MWRNSKAYAIYCVVKQFLCLTLYHCGHIFVVKGGSMARLGIFVDAENIFYAQKQDLKWFIDWKKLLDHLSEGHQVVDRQFFTIKPKFNDPRKYENRRKFVQFLMHIGFSVREKEPKFISTGNGTILQKSNIDIEIVMAILASQKNWDEIVFVGGDSDFAPLLQHLKDSGKTVIVVSTKETGSFEVRNVANKYIDLENLKPMIEKK
jgi:uncharacterized LabA/DUF88 family protein